MVLALLPPDLDSHFAGLGRGTRQAQGYLDTVKVMLKGCEFLQALVQISSGKFLRKMLDKVV